jgi:hypothetical protein
MSKVPLFGHMSKMTIRMTVRHLLLFGSHFFMILSSRHVVACIISTQTLVAPWLSPPARNAHAPPQLQS